MAKNEEGDGKLLLYMWFWWNIASYKLNYLAINSYSMNNNKNYGFHLLSEEPGLEFNNVQPILKEISKILNVMNKLRLKAKIMF